MGAQGAKGVDSGNEWATPDPVVQQAADFLKIDGFDLDPAATAENSKGRDHYDRAANGTVQPWHGFVWLNPPFSAHEDPCQPDCQEKKRKKACQPEGKRGHCISETIHGAIDFAKKAAQELEAGNVEAVAWHGPVAPDTAWYGLLWPFASLVVDYTPRIRYNGGKNGGTFPSQTIILKPTKNDGTVPLMRLPVPVAAREAVEQPKRGMRMATEAEEGVIGAARLIAMNGADTLLLATLRFAVEKLDAERQAVDGTEVA